jgi:small subunit ribosomal protein S1
MVDVGLKREGLVPQRDLDRLGEDVVSELEPGQEVTTRVVRPEDREGNLVLSMYQARLETDWRDAEQLLKSGELWHGEVTGYNKGGLTVQYGGLQGFIPGSHLWTVRNRRLSPEQREAIFREYLGRELPLGVIEVERDRRRLIFSERVARRKLRKVRLVELLDELQEGEVCEGTVSRLCDFGAFVDLGGADGMIHISELCWRRIRHPKEVLHKGDTIKVYVLRLDRDRKRIGLSLKRLEPDPWSLVDTTYHEGQLVEGRVTSIADFGAFAALDIGVEGLIHISELAEPVPDDPRQVVDSGEEVLLRVLRIESDRRRIGLSLRRVSSEERTDWLRERGEVQAVDPDVDGAVPTSEEEGSVTEGLVEIVEEDLSQEDPMTEVEETDSPEDERVDEVVQVTAEAAKEQISSGVPDHA